MEGLYAEFASPLQRIVRSRLSAPPTVIEDACQAAWGRLLRDPERVRRETVLGWLTTTAFREALKLAWREGRDTSLEAELEAHGERGLNPLSARTDYRLEYRELLGCLRHLSVRQQRVLWLHALGLRYTEIAGVEGCSRRTVERQLLRARRRLGAAVAR